MARYEKNTPRKTEGVFAYPEYKKPVGRLSLGELRSATGGFETVLNSFERRFSLVFRAFPAFQCSVVLFLNQGKWCIFNQHPAS